MGKRILSRLARRVIADPTRDATTKQLARGVLELLGEKVR